MRTLIVVGLVLALAGCGGSSVTPPASPSPAASTAPAGQTSAGVEVRVFFIPGGADPCGTVSPVVRKVAGPVSAAIAIRELLAGPTAEEATAGFTSLFGAATADALLDATVADRIARISFRDLRQVIRSSPSTWCSSRRNASSRPVGQLAMSSVGTTSSISGSASMSASVSGRK